jgi:uncharacterized peroxidase-related enzyme
MNNNHLRIVLIIIQSGKFYLVGSPSFPWRDHHMSRIPAIDPAHASNASKPLLDAVQKSLGITPNLFKITAQSPETLEGLLGLNGALAKGRLSAAEREAIALAVAEINACDYCLSAHTVLGGGAGLSEKDIFAARRAEAADPRLAAILAFSRIVMLKRGHASDADLALVRAAGLFDAEILEIVGNTVLNVLTIYLNNVAETEIDFPHVRADVPKAA